MKVLLIGFGKINKIVYSLIESEVIGIVDLDKEIINDIPDVIVDFSHPTFLQKTIYYSKKYMIPVLIGTTGYDEEKMAQIRELSTCIPILMSSNFSLGVYLIKKMIDTNKHLLENYECNINETHHISKKDSPSGTALSIRKIIPKSTIKSIRTTEKECIHQVVFTNKNEQIKIEHQINDRREFAFWTIKSLNWLVNQEKGLYSFEDFINRV